MNSIQWILNLAVRALAIGAFLIVAPVLYVTVPFIAVANVHGNYETMMLFTGGYTLLGPFAAAFWTMFILNWMNVHAGQKTYSLGKNIGIMFAAGVGSVLAEAALVLVQCFTQVFGSRMYASDMFNHFYIVAPFAVFAPVLVSVYRRRQREKRDAEYIESDRFMKQYAIDVQRHTDKQVQSQREASWLAEIGVRA
jgi:hypothetical protein